MNEPKLLLSPEDAATKLDIGRTRLYALMSSGAIPSVRIGRSRKIPAAGLDGYVARLVAEQEQAGEPVPAA